MINIHYMATGQQPGRMNNTWIPVDETLESSYQYPAVSLRVCSSPSGADLVRIQAKQVVCEPHDTTGATANRFENDLVRQPQADCFSVSVFLIIPHKDRGSLLVSLTQTEPADHRYESDMFSLALVDTVAEPSLMVKKEKKSMSGYCSLS